MVEVLGMNKLIIQYWEIIMKPKFTMGFTRSLGEWLDYTIKYGGRG
jgi:hypothetical protein